MGNFNNEIFKHSVTIDLKKPERGLIKLMSFDLDFIENEEYYREDTLKLGYKNEAERIVKEYLLKNKIKTQNDFRKCCINITNKIFDSTSYYADNDIEFTKINSTKFKVTLTGII